MSPLLECVPNFSEGRRAAVVARIGDTFAGVPGCYLLDSSRDESHNRSVFTIAGEPDALSEAVLRAGEYALSAIDLREHQGVHPRIGALDVCPFVPIGDAEMAQAVDLAHRVADLLASELDLPIFLYGAASPKDATVELSELRKGQFEGLAGRFAAGLVPDRGPARVHPSGGATAVGARFFLIAFNVNLETDDLTLARRIARKIRERDGGLAAVRALGLRLADCVQVSMNLCDFRVTGIVQAYDAVSKLAAASGVRVRESELIGLAPEAAINAEVAARVSLPGFVPEQRILERRLAGR